MYNLMNNYKTKVHVTTTQVKNRALPAPRSLAEPSPVTTGVTSILTAVKILRLLFFPHFSLQWSSLYHIIQLCLFLNFFDGTHTIVLSCVLSLSFNLLFVRRVHVAHSHDLVIFFALCYAIKNAQWFVFSILFLINVGLSTVWVYLHNCAAHILGLLFLRTYTQVSLAICLRVKLLCDKICEPST